MLVLIRKNLGRQVLLSNTVPFRVKFGVPFNRKANTHSQYLDKKYYCIYANIDKEVTPHVNIVSLWTMDM